METVTLFIMQLYSDIKKKKPMNSVEPIAKVDVIFRNYIPS
jgi:hypothetical protein